MKGAIRIHEEKVASLRYQCNVFAVVATIFSIIYLTWITLIDSENSLILHVYNVTVKIVERLSKLTRYI